MKGAISNLPSPALAARYLGTVRRIVTLTDLPRLDVRTLGRHGYLEPGGYSLVELADQQSTGFVTIAAATDFFDLIGEGSLRWATATVSLDTTKVTYGWRKWFRCPTCDRRCAVLLFDFPNLTCARCSDKAYRSATLGRKDRRLLRCHALAKRCGTTITENLPTRPRWMRQARWDDLVSEFNHAQATVADDIDRGLSGRVRRIPVERV